LSQWTSHVLSNDVGSLALSSAALALYHVWLRWQERRNPHYTVQAVNRTARAIWVKTLMALGKPDVIAVQTLRNSTMAATFLASTAVLLIIGVLTLSGQGDKLGSTWHSLNLYGATHSELFLFKLLLLLADLFTVFFSFTLAIRLFNHVGYLINVPFTPDHRVISPEHVAEHLNRAGSYYSMGMRAFYFIVPLVFWLFGPHFMLLSTLGLIIVLYRIDRAPKLLQEGVGF
jgi:uncharacterized membrane protein